MSTSETPPPLFLLPPCLLSSSSLPLAKAGAAPNLSAPPPSSFADPVKKPRREVSDLPSFSSRYVRSLMYSLSFSGMTRVLATSVHRRSFDLFRIPVPLRTLRPELLGTELYLSFSMESTNVGGPRITARLRLPMIYLDCFYRGTGVNRLSTNARKSVRWHYGRAEKRQAPPGFQGG